MILDYLRLSYESIKHRKLRSWLTMLGIFIGIAAVVSLISVGEGMQESIEAEFEKMGANMITVMPGGGMAAMAMGGSADKLTTKDEKTIEKVKGIENAASMIYKSAKVKFNDVVKYPYILALPTEKEKLDVFTQMGQFEIENGRMLEQKDKYATVVGYLLINEEDMFDKKVSLRSNIEIKDKSFKVVGSIKKIGNNQDDSTIYIPLETAEELFDSKDKYDMIYARSLEGLDPSEVAEDIERALRNEKNEKEGEETFSISTAEDLLESFGMILNIVQAVLVGIAAIALLVGSIGIMNTMYTSVLERTREIGIMKSIGARNKDIMMIFLVESGGYGFVGGIIGIIIGLGLSKGVEFAAQNYLGASFLQASMNPVLIIGALIFSVIVGALAGVAPARQAAKMKPVDALRYE